jgi:two-component system CheB/CheR fusion protein
VRDLFSITSNDEGRPIADFAHRLLYDDLIKDARAVLADLAPIRREIPSRAGLWYDVRLRPYRTIDDKIDGVVITFVDVTERRHVEEALRASESRLRQQQRLVELSHDPIFIWDFESGIVEWNRGSEELYGYTRAEAVGKQTENLLSTTVVGATRGEMMAQLLERGSWRGEAMQRTKDGRKLTVEKRLQLESFDGRRLVLESTHDITDRKLWERRQRLLLGELTHRVKNTLAIVQSIAHQTLRFAQTPEEFNERFTGRLAALATAHGLLVQSDWKGADLAALARDQLAPYLSDEPDRLVIDGPAILLPADLATPFGLVLHELATNAVKYGALSRPDGIVSLAWKTALRNQQRAITVVWSERNGPRVRRPGQVGLGSSLIDHAIPAAEVKREFKAEGLICTIELPLPEEAADHHGATAPK